MTYRHGAIAATLVMGLALVGVAVGASAVAQSARSPQSTARLRRFALHAGPRTGAARRVPRGSDRDARQGGSKTVRGTVTRIARTISAGVASER